MDQIYLNIFDEPVLLKRKRRNAGYSVTVVVVAVALAVIVMLFWYQTTGPVNTAIVRDDADLLLDQESRDLQRQTATNAVFTNSNVSPMSATEEATVRTYTQAELSGIRSRLEAQQDYEAALLEVEQLEVNLESAYAGAAGASQEAWNELRSSLGELEDSLREGSADSLGLLASLLQSFEAEVRVDEEEQ